MVTVSASFDFVSVDVALVALGDCNWLGAIGRLAGGAFIAAHKASTEVVEVAWTGAIEAALLSSTCSCAL